MTDRAPPDTLHTATVIFAPAIPDKDGVPIKLVIPAHGIAVRTGFRALTRHAARKLCAALNRSFGHSHKDWQRIYAAAMLQDVHDTLQ